jgi:tRNA-Thr(GGU) m(6)t(6)A37 methyltransferase TsaA
MVAITAQVSVYPLGQSKLEPTIDQVLAIFHQHGLEAIHRPMSILVSGDNELVFAAIQTAFHAAASHGETVMVATLSNAYPKNVETPEGDFAILENGDDDVTCHPIGTVQNEFDETSHGELMRASKSRIILDPNLVAGLQGINPGQQVMVLFYFDRVDDFELLQHPRGDSDRPKQGVFTIRSPRRPNPIGVTVVDLLSIDGNVLTVRGLDAFDGTPVLDLKPI